MLAIARGFIMMSMLVLIMLVGIAAMITPSFPVAGPDPLMRPAPSALPSAPSLVPQSAPQGVPASTPSYFGPSRFA